MEGMTPLVVGTLLAIAALLLVLAPLVSDGGATSISEQDKRSNDTRIADEEEQALVKPVARALLARDALRADEYVVGHVMADGRSGGPARVSGALPGKSPAPSCSCSGAQL